MSSSDNDSELQNETPIIKKNTIHDLIKNYYPSHRVTENNGEWYILRDGDKNLLIYEKKINEDIELYLDKISNFLFGPVLVHKEDYYKIQKKLLELGIEKCGVIISSSFHGNSVKHIAEIIFDPFYIEFIKTAKLASKKRF